LFFSTSSSSPPLWLEPDRPIVAVNFVVITSRLLTGWGVDCGHIRDKWSHQYGDRDLPLVSEEIPSATQPCLRGIREFCDKCGFRFSASTHKASSQIQNLADFLAQASLFPGITLLVAGLSQWNSISSFHLWVTVILADLSTSGRVVVLLNLFYSTHRVTRIQAALAALFQTLFLVSLGLLIYRLSNWTDTPGSCFAFKAGGRHSTEERDWVRLWVIVQLAVWGYWHLICPWQVYLARHMLERVPERIRFWFSFVFYVILDLFLWIWQLYLIAQVGLSLHMHQ